MTGRHSHPQNPASPSSPVRGGAGQTPPPRCRSGAAGQARPTVAGAGKAPAVEGARCAPGSLPGARAIPRGPWRYVDELGALVREGWLLAILAFAIPAGLGLMVAAGAARRAVGW